MQPFTMSESRSATNDAGDSAPTDVSVAKGNASKGKSAKAGAPGKKQGGSNPTSKSNTRPNKTESGSAKQTPGFADGNSVLTSYGLSVSGRKERILSPFKTDKFFHMVEQSWHQLVRIKPHLTERFSLAEFRHVSALQLFQRIESVKFDTLGIKPSAQTRIPLPRSTRVFQPIWSVLANIGSIDDDDLRVLYIPDGILPRSEDLTDPKDIEALLSCTLYDWPSSWEHVLAARKQRAPLQERDGITVDQDSNETESPTREELIKQISEQRRKVASAKANLASGKYRLIDGYLYQLPAKKKSESSSPKGKGKESAPDDNASVVSESPDEAVSDTDLKKGTRYWGPESAQDELDRLFDQARSLKEKAITPRFDLAYKAESYTVADGTVTTAPGAYGAWLHWDPRLWLEYEQFVEIVTPIALFSLSMPAETTGTYAWILPVEKRQDDDSSVSARMPKASIAPVTWILSLLLQSSTLPYDRRSTFYVETDRLQNVLGLRQRYIRAAIKDPSAVEQYGTY